MFWDISERDRLKPAPPPKPAGLGPQLAAVPQKVYNITVPADFLSRMQLLLKQARDIRIEVGSNVNQYYIKLILT